MRSVWKVLELLPEYRWKIFVVSLISTFLGAIATGTPYLYKHVIDTLARLLNGSLDSTHASSAIQITVLMFTLSRVLIVLFDFFQWRVSHNLFVESIGSLRERIIEKTSIQSIDYFEKNRVGEIMDRYGNGVAAISWWINSLCEGALTSILQAIFIIFVLLIKAPIIGIAMFFVVAFNIYDSYKKLIDGKEFNLGWLKYNGKMSGLLSEMFSNISTVRSFGGEPAIKKRYLENQQLWKVERENLYKVNSRSDFRRNVINSSSTILVVGFISWWALNGHYTLGDILLVLLLTQSLMVTITPISNLINKAGEAEAGASRLLDLLNQPTSLLIKDLEPKVQLKSIESIRFQNVSFKYPGKTSLVLRDVSFELKSGQTLALVGPSGSGKTTVIKLLMRFYEPTEGSILINGKDIQYFTHDSIRELLGVVLQDVALFNDSIEENIAFAKSNATSLEVRQASLAAHAHSFIENLPDQYATLVGERGIKLSGGEKQRIAIARALLKKPQLIILDEATSALDSESERLVQSGLQELMSGRTSIVIAHRLSTISNADTIVVIKDGEILEVGNHLDLINQHKSLYARLYKLQNNSHELVI